MPRRSAEYLAMKPAAPNRLQPPAWLSAAQREIWIEVTHTVLPEHFMTEDEHLLAAYCSCIAQERQAAEQIAKGDTHWKELHASAVKSMRLLNITLRLGPRQRQPATPGLGDERSAVRI